MGRVAAAVLIVYALVWTVLAKISETFWRGLWRAGIGLCVYAWPRRMEAKRRRQAALR